MAILLDTLKIRLQSIYSVFIKFAAIWFHDLERLVVS